METIETNAINYSCQCDRKWQHRYYVEIDRNMVYFSRLAARGTPPDERCTCGKVAKGSVETPMLGYTKLTVRLMTPVALRSFTKAAQAQELSEQELERRYDEFVQHLLAQESAFISWDRLEEIEEQAATIAERGLTAAQRIALSAEQQAELLH